MSKFRSLPLGAILLASTLLSACATTPMARSHQHVTPDKSHWAVQVTMHSGVYNTPTQTVMVLYNKYSRKPIAVVEGQSKELSAQLVDAFLALGPSMVMGEYLIKAEKLSCPAGTLCGTLVQVNNSAGASAGSSAEAAQTNN